MRTFFKSPLFSKFSKGKVRPDSNDRPVPTSALPPHLKPGVCRCKRTEDGRNLVICIDGTSNQFGEMNTNVIELYSMLDKGRKKQQLTWYHSGIGTYARPSFISPAFYLQVLSHLIDLAIAWNFERTIMAAYEWLSENYEEGDCIYLFGFSRGAFQVRVLAAMIDKVGLIHKGNAKQIPFAYELYSDPESDKPSRSKSATGSSSPAPKISLTKRFQKFLCRNREEETDLSNKVSMAEHFKNTFSQPDVRVHFVGAWDTVSSIGVVRGKKMLPRTVDGMEHVCYFRHALALDERRVKFLPEYAHGGSSMPGKAIVDPQNGKSSPTPMQSGNVTPHGSEERPQTLEVWFAGTHSDIGGGNTANPDMDRSRPPLRWMVYEARAFGLRTRLFERELLPTEKIEFKESLSAVWKVFEIIPFRRLTFTSRKEGKEITHKPHLGAGRKLQHGQKIHISVVDGLGKYHPKARPPAGAEGLWSTLPSDILSQRIWQEGDADTFVKPLVAKFVKNKDNSAWTTVCAMANSGKDGLQAAYEEVMRFLIVESDDYKADDIDMKRLLECAQPLFDNKLLRLYSSTELGETMFKIGESNNSTYQTVAWDFLSKFIHYSNDTVFPIQFVCYHIEQLCREECGVSYDILQKSTSFDGDGIQAAYEEVIRLLMAETNHLKGDKSDMVRLLHHAKSLFSKKSGKLRLQDSRQLSKTMIEIASSSNPMYQIAAWAFFTEFLQYSSNTIVPFQFIDYHMGRLLREKNDYSRDILLKVTPPDDSSWKNLYEFVVGFLIKNNNNDNWVLERSAKIQEEIPVSPQRFTDVKTMSMMIQKSDNKRYRHAAWVFLDRYTDCQRLNLKESTGGAMCLAYSPDGTIIVSGSRDNTLILWNAVTGMHIGEPLSGHTDEVTCVAFSPDGERVVSGSADNNLRIWNTRTGQQIGEPFEGHADRVRSVAFSPDGKLIVSGAVDWTIRIWDAQTGEQLGHPLKGHSYIVTSVKFSPDGRTIVSGSMDKAICIWDVESHQRIGQPLQEHEEWINSVAVSPDGTLIVSGSSDRTLRLWNSATRKHIGQAFEGHTSTVHSVAFSPDGRRIVSGSWDKTVRIWEVSTGKQIGEPMRGHCQTVDCVVFSPDGTQVASCDGETVRVWDISLKLWDITE